MEKIYQKEWEKCLLCHDASCSSQCPVGLDPAKTIRSLKFQNSYGAKEALYSANLCLQCDSKACEEACVANRLGTPIQISKIMEYAHTLKRSKAKVDLSISFLGKECENPFMLSSSVVASNYEMVAKAFDMGWAGVAFKTIGTFIPEEVSPRFSTVKSEGNSFMGFKNIEQISDHSLEENYQFISKLKENYPSKLIIASILGQDEEEWTYLAKLMTEAGADIIECNFSCPHMSGEGLGSDVGQDPHLVAKFTAATRRGTHLPILAKMTPNIGNMEIPAMAAMESGADGIAAINTIKSIMNIDLDSFVSAPAVEGKSCVGGYSGNAVKPIALRFIHDMKKHPKLAAAPISGMGGIENYKDAAEFIALGCENLQITTAVMQYGYRIIEDLVDGLSSYLADKGMTSLQQLVGVALPHLVPAHELERSAIVYPKFHRHLCIGCGRCYVSCFDGGHQAIQWSEEKKPILKAEKCVGCQLCQAVCPAEAISNGPRVLQRRISS